MKSRQRNHFVILTTLLHCTTNVVKRKYHFTITSIRLLLLLLSSLHILSHTSSTHMQLHMHVEAMFAYACWSYVLMTTSTCSCVLYNMSLAAQCRICHKRMTNRWHDLHSCLKFWLGWKEWTEVNDICCKSSPNAESHHFNIKGAA